MYGGDIRICIILMVLLALVGCSRKHPTEHHILPVGFTGVYKIEKAGGPSGGYMRAVTCWDKSMAMRAELVHSYEHRGKNKTDIRHWKYETTHRRDGDMCECFGHQEFKGELNGNAMSFNEQFRILAGDDFFLYYRKRDNEEEPSIYMAGNVEELLFTMQAHDNDGGFLLGRMGGIGSASKMAEVMSESNNLQLIGQKNLGQSLCHIVEAKTKYGTYTVWIAPEKGYNALKYTVIVNIACRNVNYVLE